MPFKISKPAKLILISALLAILIFSLSCQKREKIVYGVSPYQDTILPVVADLEGWYKEEGLDVEIRVLPWGEVMNSLAAGAVDVAIQNFNSFQAPYHNINERGGDVIFYYPFYVFKGAAIMIRKDGPIKSLEFYLKEYPNSREKAIEETVKQLKGKTVITTKGTEMEQIVLSAIDKAGLKPNQDVKIIHALPDDGLNAFLGGAGDAYSGGLTERTKAKKEGAIEMVESADLAPPVIDGIVTTRKFANSHEKELSKLINLWFKTIRFMEDDLDNRSIIVIDYLGKVGSVKYTVDEYKYTWFYMEVYPKYPEEAKKLFLDENSNFYWKRSWDSNNEFLTKDRKIPAPVPYDAFWGNKVQSIYVSKSP